MEIQKRNLIGLGIVLFLLIAIPVTLFLAQRQQIFKPKAEEITCQEYSYCSVSGPGVVSFGADVDQNGVAGSYYVAVDVSGSFSCNAYSLGVQDPDPGVIKHCNYSSFSGGLLTLFTSAPTFIPAPTTPPATTAPATAPPVQSCSTVSCTTCSQTCIGGICGWFQNCTDSCGGSSTQSCSPNPTTPPATAAPATAPPVSICQTISCPVPRDLIGCSYPRAVTSSCDPNKPPSCGELVCPTATAPPATSAPATTQPTTVCPQIAVDCAAPPAGCSYTNVPTCGGRPIGCGDLTCTTPTQPPSGNGNWVFCSKEFETCTVPNLNPGGSVPTRFGANGSFAYGGSSSGGSFPCNSTTFGGQDPAVGVTKECDYQTSGSTTATTQPTNVQTPNMYRVSRDPSFANGGQPGSLSNGVAQIPWTIVAGAGQNYIEVVYVQFGTTGSNGQTNWDTGHTYQAKVKYVSGSATTPPATTPPATTPPATTSPLGLNTCTPSNGDASGPNGVPDGVVDLYDHAEWVNEFKSGHVGKADFNCDGKVNFIDYNIWRQGFNHL